MSCPGNMHVTCILTGKYLGCFFFLGNWENKFGRRGFFLLDGTRSHLAVINIPPAKRLHQNTSADFLKSNKYSFFFLNISNGMCQWEQIRHMSHWNFMFAFVPAYYYYCHYFVVTFFFFFCLRLNNEKDSFENQKLMLCNISLILHLTILHVANL